MTEINSEFYNFIIVGGGPVGLTAGITAARNGYKAVVLEQADKAGPRPRGEGVNHDPLFDELLGPDFLMKQCHRMDGSQVFHSPGDLKQVRLQGKKDIHFFEWERFIERLVKKAHAEGVRLLVGSKVIGPIQDSELTCTGVRYKDLSSGSIHELKSNAVLACDGHQSVMGRHFGIDYDRINCAMVKCIATNPVIDFSQNPELQFYLIGNGDLSYEPNFPQCVAYVFPIGDRKMECGLMLRMLQSRNMETTVKNPDKKTFYKVWQRLKEEYPGFSEYFKGAEIEFEDVTGLSNACMVKEVVPSKGLVLAGDSAGFIDPFGSSGLYSGMAMAKFWVDQLSNRLDVLGRGNEVKGPIKELWNPLNLKRFKKNFSNTDIYKHIKGSYFLIGLFEWYIFKHLRTADKINKRWKIIEWMLNKAA